VAEHSVRHHFGQIGPAQAEIPDHGRFVGRPYRANKLLGEVNDVLGKA
jgi:hypothetical protein